MSVIVALFLVGASTTVLWKNVFPVGSVFLLKKHLPKQEKNCQKISQDGWLRRVMNLIYERTGVKYHEIHIYRLLHRLV